MKFILSVLLIALVSFALCLFLPWWSIAFAAFLVSVVISQKPVASFFSGFIAVFILWTLLSVIISSANEHLLAKKVSMLILKSSSTTLLILITGFIGGLVAGLGALTGSFVRKPVQA